MVEDGQIAVIHYTARVPDEDGNRAILDTTDVDVARRTGIYHDYRDYKPLEFRVGDGSVAPALDRAVRDLEPGDETTVLADPEEAFGERSADAVHEFDRDAFEEFTEEEPEPDLLVTTAEERTGWITAVDEDTVTVDFNHELAGRRLQIEVELVTVHGAPGEGTEKDWEKRSGERLEDRS